MKLVSSSAVSIIGWTAGWLGATAPMVQGNRAAAGPTASHRPPASLLKQKLVQKELPDTGEEWTTLSNGMEFQPASDLSPRAQRHLRQLEYRYYQASVNYKQWIDLGGWYDDDSEAYATLFASSTETYYDDYAQAWRALGFYIDCDDQQQQQQQQGRKLQEQQDETSCTRYLLWAAYVDEGYEGNGMGEYMYYDRKSGHWNDNACQENSNATRCVKMDCHLPNTHYSLLGYFKEPQYDEWLNQLFDNEGDCLWTDGEYQFMQSNLDVWPDGCTESNHLVKLSENETVEIYYDMMPSSYGEMSIGLYTDDACLDRYHGALSVMEVMRGIICTEDGNGDMTETLGALCATNMTNYNKAWAAVEKRNNQTLAAQQQADSTAGDGARALQEEEQQQQQQQIQYTIVDLQHEPNLWSLASSMDEWNKAFDVYKQCQPCKAYDLTDVVAGLNYEANANGDRYNFNQEGQGDDETFKCHADGADNNVNQCMKFRANTRMMTATWNDVELAVNQGTVMSVRSPHVNGTSGRYSLVLPTRKVSNRAKTAAWIAMAISILAFLLAACRLWETKREEASVDDFLADKPLMGSYEIQRKPRSLPFRVVIDGADATVSANEEREMMERERLSV